MMKAMIKKSQSGQIILIVLLIMVVLLTIGLALVVRSVTDIRISTETKESTRAFSAAEAGIEEALRQTSLAGWSLSEEIGDVSVEVSVTETNAFETTIGVDETAEVNLNGYSNKIKVSLNTDNAALIIALITPKGPNDYQIQRWALKKGNDWTDCKPAEFTSGSSVTISVPSGAGEKALRIRALCGDTNVEVEALEGATLPAQSYLIRSQATGEGGESRAVEVIKYLPALPAIFDFVLFSDGDLIK